MIDSTAIDGLLADAASDGTFPGVIAVAGDRDGTLYEGAFGRLSVDGEETVRADTMLAIASMTKAITSVAALQLIEQGRLALDQTVSSVLPAFGDLLVLEGFDGETPRLRAPSSQATIQQLLTHTSGLAYCATTSFSGSPTRSPVAAHRSMACRSATIPVSPGNTASAPTGSGRSSRRSAVRISTPTASSTSSLRWR
jgi:CubicO group peptidase (beta-lactamase class C family)